MIEKIQNYTTRRYRDRIMGLATGALERADWKRANGLFVPEGGRLAIFASRAVDIRSEHSGAAQREVIDTTAEYLRERYSQDGDFGGVDILRPNKIELAMALQDPGVSGIIAVGHASEGDYWLDGGEHFNWRNAADAIGKAGLKRLIEKRGCDERVVADSIPWGLALVGDPVTQYHTARDARIPMRAILDDNNFGPHFKDAADASTEQVINRALEGRDDFLVRARDR